MTVLFRHVLLVSMFITPLILILILVVPRLSHRYVPRMRCFVWTLITIRLLIPVHFSFRNLFGGIFQVANLLDQVDQTAVIAALQNALSNDGAVGIPQQESIIATIDWSSLALLWFAGMMLFLFCNLIAYHMTVKKLQRWSTPVTDPFLLKIFCETKKQLSISNNISLSQTSRTNIPLLTGFIHPQIYLPNNSRQLSVSELSDILSHELCHYKRKDLFLKLAFLLSNAIHWFNPIVYFMLRQAELDVEMACDSDVLRRANPFIRKRYALTILSFVEEIQSAPTPLTTRFYGGKKQMKLRFTNIISQNKRKSGMAFLGVFVLLIAVCGIWEGNSAFAASVAQKTSPKHTETISSDISPHYGIGEMAWPVPGFYNITSSYGARYDGADFHSGIDIADKAIYGAPVIAAEAGTVLRAIKDYEPGVGYGMYIIIAHGDDISTLYGQLSEIFVNSGDTVDKGQVIANVGSTGYTTEPHLQFEVRKNGITVDPVTYLMPAEELK